MPRNPPDRAAQTHVTPFVGLGDVLRLTDFETWEVSGRRSHYWALLYAVFSVLAACAHVRPATAVLFMLADYEADQLVVPRKGLKKEGRLDYPVILLPAAKAVIEDYLAHRRELGIGGIHLLVDGKGAPLRFTVVYNGFAGFSKRCGHFGGQLIERLIEFHDLQLRTERREPAACIALRCGYRGEMDNAIPQGMVDAACGDRDLLERVLVRNHSMAGPKGGSIGGHGRAKARKTGRLFFPPKLARRFSPAARSIPVCVKLLAKDWRGDKIKERRKVIDEDLPALVALLDDGLITWSDLRHLLYCSMGTARYHVAQHRRSLETEEQRDERRRVEAQWQEKAPEFFLARPRGEDFPAFHARIAVEADYPFGRAMLSATLKLAGVLPHQVARRRKKRMSGKNEKSKKAESRSVF
jgi:hypothetical protein